MDLQCISLPLKCIGNVSKRIENALQRIFNALQRKNASPLFSLSLLFPNRVTIEDILSNFPVFSVGDVLEILEIMQEIFLDIPNLKERLAFFSFSSVFTHHSCLNVEEYAFSDSGSEDELSLWNDEIST